MKTLAEVQTILNLSPKGGEVVVSALTSDSRDVEPGSLFVALRGDDVDGHDFIEQAIERGCVGVVGEKKPVSFPFHLPFFAVSDSRLALSELAPFFYGYPADKLFLVGITGTNGKSSVAGVLENILLQAEYQVGVLGTVDYHYHDKEGRLISTPSSLTTPDILTLQKMLAEMVEAGVTHVIMEASSHALVQGRLQGLSFDLALFTNLSRDHLDYHGDMESYFQAKKNLFTSALKENGSAVICVNSQSSDDYGRKLVKDVRVKNKYTVGFADCDILIGDVRADIKETDFTLEFTGDQSPLKLHSSLIGLHNVYNLALAAGAAFAIGLTKEDIARAMARVKPVAGRLERVVLTSLFSRDCPQIFIDYAHTPDGLDNVLSALAPLTKGKLICVFGCGGDRDRGKRAIMGRVAATKADVLLVTSDNPRSERPEKIMADVEKGLIAGGAIKKDFSELFLSGGDGVRYILEEDRRKAIEAACVSAGGDDVVLIAGKGHEQYQILADKTVYFDDRIEVLNSLSAWTLKNLALATGGKLVSGGSDSTTVFSGISTDTRALQKGEVFLALRGDNFDGHNFLSAALAAGCGCLIVEEKPVFDLDIPCIVVDDTLAALGSLALFKRKVLKRDELKVIGITGSSGKTTVKEMVACVFQEFYSSLTPVREVVLKTQGNFNNLIGLPLSLLPLKAEHRVAVLEMGMNRPGEIEKMTKIVEPDVACINNVHGAHLEGLGSIEGVAAAKGEIYSASGVDCIKVANYDDPLVLALAAKSTGRKVGFAVTGTGRRNKPVVAVTRITGKGEEGSAFTLEIAGLKKRVHVKSPGLHNVHNCAAAAAISYAAGADIDSICQGLENYRTVDKRMQFMDFPGGVRVLNDSYNANPESMAAALRTVMSFGRGKCVRVAALGDMLELGVEAEKYHYDTGKLVASLGYDYLLVTGEYGEAYLSGARDKGMTGESSWRFANLTTMADWFYHMITTGVICHDDWVLLKGSRGMEMERLFAILTRRFESVKSGGIE